MASLSDNCILCKEAVRERQQGVQCDGCLKWNHRTCDTGKFRITVKIKWLFLASAKDDWCARDKMF